MDKESQPVMYARDKPKDCRYCYFWQGKYKGCAMGGPGSCFYIIPQEEWALDRCNGCPYGRDAPCIGWCTVDVMDAVFKRKKGCDAEK